MPQGLGEAEVRELFLNRRGNTLQADGMLPFAETDARIWDTGAEVFLPARRPAWSPRSRWTG
ncbi:hypothetical protein ACFQZC_34690 [Streptacidiphilus monticola]